MTRGIFVYISDTILETCQFNGDMYPDGMAEQFIYAFKRGKLETKDEFIDFVKSFNKRNYGYPEDVIIPEEYSNIYDFDYSTLFHLNYSDYVYVINESGDDIPLGDSQWIENGGLAILTYKVEKIIYRVKITTAEESRKKAKVHLAKNIILAYLENLKEDCDCFCTDEEIISLVDEIKEAFNG
jgi:hypothetical protein